jgi:hypothetical protein
MRWVWRAITGITLAGGWLFILVQNKFHIDAPVVVVMLAYLAVVMTITNLWRVGASAVRADAGDDTWARPLGQRGELEREKKGLLRSIKEAEFDQAMGKLSKADAEQLIQMYRARAIEVIKELERLDAGAVQTPREQIAREVAARIELAKRTGADKKAKAKAKQADKAETAETPDMADKAETVQPDVTQAEGAS